jgi:hypothetical protein
MEMATISGILLIAALIMVLYHAGTNPPRIALWIPVLLVIMVALMQFIPIK